MTVGLEPTVAQSYRHEQQTREAAPPKGGCGARWIEEASRLRDQLSLMRATPDAEVSEDMEMSRLVRQQPGAMGLGTSDQKFCAACRLDTAAAA